MAAPRWWKALARKPGQVGPPEREVDLLVGLEPGAQVLAEHAHDDALGVVPTEGHPGACHRAEHAVDAQERFAVDREQQVAGLVLPEFLQELVDEPKVRVKPFVHDGRPEAADRPPAV